MESMKNVLFTSPGEALIASCVIAWAFFLLAWFFELSFIWKAVERFVSSYVKLPQKELDSIVSGVHVRAVGFVHNTIQVILSMIALTSPELWNNSWHAVTPLTQATLAISAGFFLWDTAVSIRRAPVDGPEFILHGALCLSFYLYISLSNNFHFYGVGFLLWELSTPFVHVRWFMHKIGLKDTKIYVANGSMMMGMFFLCRICWGGYLGLRFVVQTLGSQDSVSPVVIWALRGICVTLNGLNWYWFRLMLKIALRWIFPSTTPTKATTQNKQKVKA